ncbi:MAG: 30S ribosomal protein S12 methylthiotransferase RimO [bacterium]|nr:30S ribosomal protein S12 methylthiotransferase RimO [bacterium]
MENKNRTTVSFVSLGCFKNLVDTEVLGGMLEKKNMQLVSSYEDSDWVVVNTCGFIRDAKEESIDEILAALEKKESGETKHVAVFGCLTQRYYDDLKTNFKEADIVWGVNNLEELANHIQSTSQNETGNKPAKPVEYKDTELFLYNDKHTRIITTTPNVTFIKISEGCNMKCAFCAIPKFRGQFRSRELDSIVREAAQYKEMGFQELNLISQNSNYYGKDRSGKTEFPLLLKELSKLGFNGVRVLYLMPQIVTDEIIDAFSYPSIIPYFDLPFQHVSQPLLKAMNRVGNAEQNMKLIENIRNKFNDAVIRSTFIVGFPGETEEDFNQLQQFAKESRIERFGVFGYSDEDNTEAFDLENKIAPHIIEDRKERLMDVSDHNVEQYNKKLVELGESQDFLPLGPWDNNTTIGRIKSQGQDTDGLTRIDTPFNNDYSAYPVKITGFQHELLDGERL